MPGVVGCALHTKLNAGSINVPGTSVNATIKIPENRNENSPVKNTMISSYGKRMTMGGNIKMLGVAMQTTIKTLFEKGYNKAQIARMLNIDKKTVRKILKDMYKESQGHPCLNHIMDLFYQKYHLKYTWRFFYGYIILFHMQNYRNEKALICDKKKKKQSASQYILWCEGWDLNPHDVTRYPLKVVRLPIPPPSHLFISLI